MFLISPAFGNIFLREVAPSVVQKFNIYQGLQRRKGISPVAESIRRFATDLYPWYRDVELTTGIEDLDRILGYWVSVFFN